MTNAIPFSNSFNMAFNCELPGPMRNTNSRPFWVMVVVKVKSSPTASNFCENVKGWLLSMMLLAPGLNCCWWVFTSGSPHLLHAQDG